MQCPDTHAVDKDKNSPQTDKQKSAKTVKRSLSDNFDRDSKEMAEREAEHLARLQKAMGIPPTNPPPGSPN